MKKLLKQFWLEEDGLQTVEMILILIVLVGLISVFQRNVTTWLNIAIEKANTMINVVN